VIADSVLGEGSTFTVTLLSGGGPGSAHQLSTERPDARGTSHEEPYVAA
jgi:hypothetical protein